MARPDHFVPRWWFRWEELTGKRVPDVLRVNNKLRRKGATLATAKLSEQRKARKANEHI